jgi:hypothetical protein
MYRKSDLRRARILGNFRELCALALCLLSPADDLHSSGDSAP